MLCSYGCGKEAKFQLKNGKWCCSESWNSCIIVGTKKSISLKGKRKSESHKKNLRISKLGKPGSNLGRKFGPHTKEWKISHSNRMSGIRNPNYGKHMSEETKRKQKESHLGKKHAPESFETREKKRQYMKNGGAIIALKGNKNPSKPEIELREIVKDLYPASEHTYKVLNYALDNALIELKIAIEYDGHFHFCSQEKIKYHKQRKEKIENEGWKFIQYTMFEKLPTKEKVKEDVEKIIMEENIV